MADGWWQSFFDDWYLDNWIDPASYDERTPAQVDFLVEALGLQPGACVLDSCCGEGRHSREFARRGFRTVGVDQSEDSLERARRASPDLEFRHLDLRDMTFDREFDAAINLFTAFGYMPDEENQRAMNAIASALKPGGVLALDTMGRDWLVRNFRATDWRRMPSGVLLEERHYDAVAGRICAKMTILHDGAAPEVRETDIRLYTPLEMTSLLREAGLEPVRWYGGYDGSELGLDSRRLIVIARRTM